MVQEADDIQEKKVTKKRRKNQRLIDAFFKPGNKSDGEVSERLTKMENVDTEVDNVLAKLNRDAAS